MPPRPAPPVSAAVPHAPASAAGAARQPAADWVAYNARRYPGAPALEDAATGRARTWSATEDRVARLARVLAERLRVRRGDRVAALAHNDTRLLELQFACWRIGAIFVPLSWRLSVAELEVCVTDCAPAALVHDAATAENASALAGSVPATASWGVPGAEHDLDAARDAAERIPAGRDNTLDQPAQLLYTSGTTGRPKAAITTFGTLIWNALNIAGPARITGEGDRHLAALPLFHAGGLNGVTNPVLLAGGCVRVAAGFDPERALAALGDPGSRVTHFSGAPVMYLVMSGLPGFDRADFSGLRYGQLGGGYLEGELAGAYAARGVHLLPSYGATEMGPSVTTMTEAAAPHKIGSCGFPVRHTQLRLVDEAGEDVPDGEVGEAWVRGPSITPGYWGRDPAESFAPGGWFRSGDALRTDADGFCYVTGRFKDMYKSGGENVFAAEVEDVLAGHPDVAEVGVIGVPDPKWGEVGRAVVVPRPGAAPVTVESLAVFAHDRLARFKLPRSVVLVDALDRNGSGKVIKDTLRKKYGGAS